MFTYSTHLHFLVHPSSPHHIPTMHQTLVPLGWIGRQIWEAELLPLTEDWGFLMRSCASCLALSFFGVFLPSNSVFMQKRFWEVCLIRLCQMCPNISESHLDSRWDNWYFKNLRAIFINLLICNNSLKEWRIRINKEYSFKLSPYFSWLCLKLSPHQLHLDPFIVFRKNFQFLPPLKFIHQTLILCYFLTKNLVESLLTTE